MKVSITVHEGALQIAVITADDAANILEDETVFAVQTVEYEIAEGQALLVSHPTEGEDVED
jgi:hypothetical protein